MTFRVSHFYSKPLVIAESDLVKLPLQVHCGYSDVACLRRPMLSSRNHPSDTSAAVTWCCCCYWVSRLLKLRFTRSCRTLIIHIIDSTVRRWVSVRTASTLNIQTGRARCRTAAVCCACRWGTVDKLYRSDYISRYCGTGCLYLVILYLTSLHHVTFRSCDSGGKYQTSTISSHVCKPDSFSPE